MNTKRVLRIYLKVTYNLWKKKKNCTPTHAYAKERQEKEDEKGERKKTNNPATSGICPGLLRGSFVFPCNPASCAKNRAPSSKILRPGIKFLGQGVILIPLSAPLGLSAALARTREGAEGSCIGIGCPVRRTKCPAAGYQGLSTRKCGTRRVLCLLPLLPLPPPPFAAPLSSSSSLASTPFVSLFFSPSLSPLSLLLFLSPSLFLSIILIYFPSFASYPPTPLLLLPTTPSLEEYAPPTLCSAPFRILLGHPWLILGPRNGLYSFNNIGKVRDNFSFSLGICSSAIYIFVKIQDAIWLSILMN